MTIPYNAIYSFSLYSIFGFHDTYMACHSNFNEYIIKDNGFSNEYMYVLISYAFFSVIYMERSFLVQTQSVQIGLHF